MNKTYTIGLIIPDLENPFFSALAKHVEEQLREEGYTLIIASSNEDYVNDIELIKMMIAKGVDGVILAASTNSIRFEEDIIEVLEALTVPFIMVDRVFPGYKCNRVYFDNKKGSYLATQHLIQHGHHKIGHMSSRFTSRSGNARYLGYMKAMEEANLEVSESWIIDGSFKYDDGYRLAEELLRQDITGIIASNDIVAFAIMRRAHEMGIRIPEDVSMIGYDNLDITEKIGLELSSVQQDIPELSSKTVQLLMKKLSGDSSIDKIILDPTLIIRKSVTTLD